MGSRHNALLLLMTAETAGQAEKMFGARGAFRTQVYFCANPKDAAALSFHLPATLPACISVLESFVGYSPSSFLNTKHNSGATFLVYGLGFINEPFEKYLHHSHCLDLFLDYCRFWERFGSRICQDYHLLRRQQDVELVMFVDILVLICGLESSLPANQFLAQAISACFDFSSP